ncbi:TPA: sensor histidine kinase [Burkholderia territorii]|uniref:sensor histidine kinase n=1 Tax=Burkholderia territorii TaxID=1503055 RepID=UPI0011C93477|nr:ATP-binding protein [Burkholderia territorii]TXG05957.1 sensor histidine kinase [Burkholderia territorii]HDR8860310.1 sensor histidine kinase [Burkholderia territorii]HDR8866322.1 sensor histidine kinase [Burkholderia territorii]HDR8871717.1 sensor histidine kinase [Burkholderia territorii]HDR8879138.1 sensor histidine kinase [Burkholderia territorii]
MNARAVRRLRRTTATLAIVTCCGAAAWLTYVLALRHYSRLHVAEVAQRSSFYALTLESQLARYESLPRIAALEPVLVQLLDDPSNAQLREQANAYLKAVQTNADLSAAYMMAANGTTLAASNSDESGSFVGSNYAFRPYFTNAMQHGTGRFYGIGNTTGEAGYFLAVPIRDRTHPGRGLIGAVAIKASLDQYESALAKSGDIVLVVDRDNVTFLSSVAGWRYRTLTPLSAGARRKLNVTRQYGAAPLATIAAPPPGTTQPAASPEQLYVALSGGSANWYRVVYRPVGPLGWKVVMLVDPANDRRSAAFASVGALAATVLVFALVTVVRLRNSRKKERLRARVALLEAQRDIEQRIAERTAELTQANATLEEKVDALDAARRILRETRDTAIQAGKLAALGQLAAGITHELNQPLAAIMTLSSNAVRMTELGRSGDLTRNLVLINQLADRMGKIVSHVKGFARHEGIIREPVSIAESLRQALLLIEQHRKAAGVTIRDEPVPPDAIVLASSIRIEQVLVNLLANAIDASAASASAREVAVTTDVTDELVCVSVVDSGNGMTPDVMTRLFEPFFTTKSTGKGLGLGLAISQAIVDEFGGCLHARNRDEGGAVFTVELKRVTRAS